MNKFIQYTLKIEEKRTIFLQKSPKKFQSCSKCQTRRILLPKILPDIHKRIFNYSKIRKKSKVKKLNVPLETENLNTIDIPDFDDFQNNNNQVHLNQNNNGEIENNNVNSFVICQEFDNYIQPFINLENKLSVIKNDVAVIIKDLQ